MKLKLTGRVGFEAWRDALGGRNLHGWEQISDEGKQRWLKAELAIAREIITQIKKGNHEHNTGRD